jgi:hypothetical protein
MSINSRFKLPLQISAKENKLQAQVTAMHRVSSPASHSVFGRVTQPSFHSFEISKRHTVSFDNQALIAVGRTFFPFLLSNRRKRILGSGPSNRAGKERLPLFCPVFASRVTNNRDAVNGEVTTNMGQARQE